MLEKPNSSPSGAAAEAKSSKGFVVIAACLTSFLSPFMSSGVGVALPAVARSFGVDALLLSWIATSYLLSLGFFLLPVGRITDLFGRRRALLWGCLIFSGACALGAAAPAFPILLLARFIQGAGGALLVVAGMALLASAVPPEERGRALGFNVAAVYLGISLGPTLGGLLADLAGWRSVYGVCVPLGLLAALLTSRVRGEWRDESCGDLDLPGCGLYGGFLVLLLLGASSLPGARGLLLLSGSALLFGRFLAREIRVPCPAYDVRFLTTNRAFACSNAAAALNYAATFAVAFFMALYLQEVRGLSSRDTGLVLAFQPLIQAVLSPVAGRLSDRFDPGRVASGGMAFCAVGVGLLALLDARTSTGFLLIPLGLLGVGFALFSSPNTNAILRTVPPERLGFASASISVMRTLGQIVSMGIVSTAFALALGRRALSPALHPAYLSAQRTCFLLFAGICVVGILLSSIRGEVESPED